MNFPENQEKISLSSTDGDLSEIFLKYISGNNEQQVPISEGEYSILSNDKFMAKICRNGSQCCRSASQADPGSPYTMTLSKINSGSKDENLSSSSTEFIRFRVDMPPPAPLPPQSSAGSSSAGGEYRQPLKDRILAPIDNMQYEQLQSEAQKVVDLLKFKYNLSSEDTIGCTPKFTSSGGVNRVDLDDEIDENVVPSNITDLIVASLQHLNNIHSLDSPSRTNESRIIAPFTSSVADSVRLGSTQFIASDKFSVGKESKSQDVEQKYGNEANKTEQLSLSSIIQAMSSTVVSPQETSRRISESGEVKSFVKSSSSEWGKPTFAKIVAFGGRNDEKINNLNQYLPPLLPPVATTKFVKKDGKINECISKIIQSKPSSSDIAPERSLSRLSAKLDIQFTTKPKRRGRPLGSKNKRKSFDIGASSAKAANQIGINYYQKKKLERESCKIKVSCPPPLAPQPAVLNVGYLYPKKPKPELESRIIKVFCPPTYALQPVVVNVDDLCCACGQPEIEGEIYLTCKDCQVKAHPLCLRHSPEMTEIHRDLPWQCDECRNRFDLNALNNFNQPFIVCETCYDMRYSAYADPVCQHNRCNDPLYVCSVCYKCCLGTEFSGTIEKQARAQAKVKEECFVSLMTEEFESMLLPSPTSQKHQQEDPVLRWLMKRSSNEHPAGGERMSLESRAMRQEDLSQLLMEEREALAVLSFRGFTPLTPSNQK